MIGGWFVTGTDTGVGKTCVAEALLQALSRKGLRGVGMKPVASGCERGPDGVRSPDALRLCAASSVTVDYRDLNPYAFEAPIAPHIAAVQAGVEAQLEVVQRHFARLAEKADWLVVEGAGGWCVPLNRNQLLSDMARSMGLPVILVVGMRLGCINHALLTARAVRGDGVPLAGWVANCIDAAFDFVPENLAAIDQRLGAPCLALIPFNKANKSNVWQAAGDAMLADLLPDCS